MSIEHPIRAFPIELSDDERELVPLLEAWAERDRLSNFELAHQLGIDHGQLSRVRRGKSRFGLDYCCRIVERHPELRPAVARHLTASYDPPTLLLLEEASRLVREARAS